MTAARVPGRPSASRRAIASGRAMIAPARVAAFDVLAAVAAGRADLPAALAASRADAARTSATARSPPRSPPASSAGERALDHLIAALREASARAARSGGRRDPAAQRLPAPPPHARAGLGRRRRCGEPGRRAREAERQRASSTPCCAALSRSRRHAAASATASACRSTRRGTALDYLSITLSHPRWLVARWLDRFGFDAAEAWLQFNNTPAPLTLARQPPAHRRATTLQTALAAHGRARVAPARFAPDALDRRPGGSRCAAALGAGWFVVQDEASQLVTLLAGRDPGPRVLDACASPGGKTTALAAALASGGRARRLRRPRAAHAPAPAHGRRGAARPTSARAGRPAAAAALLGARSTACSSMRPAPASARSAAIPTSAGGARRPTSAPLAAAQLAMLRHAAGRGRARRPAGLRHLLERAGGERAAWSTPFLARARGVRARRCAPRAPGAACRRSSIARGHLRTTPAPPRPRGLLRRRLRAADESPDL